MLARDQTIQRVRLGDLLKVSSLIRKKDLKKCTTSFYIVHRYIRLAVKFY